MFGSFLWQSVVPEVHNDVETARASSNQVLENGHQPIPGTQLRSKDIPVFHVKTIEFYFYSPLIADESTITRLKLNCGKKKKFKLKCPAPTAKALSNFS